MVQWNPLLVQRKGRQSIVLSPMETATGPMERQAESKGRGRLSPLETATGPIERQAETNWSNRESRLGPNGEAG